MEPFASSLGARSPNRLVEIGRQPADSESSLAEFVEDEAVVHRFDDGDALGRDPSPLISRLEVPDEAVDVVLDHAGGDLDVTRRLFEVSIARLTPGGAYVVDHRLPEEIVLDLMLVSVVRPELVAGVSCTPAGVVVHRGPWPATFETLSYDDLRSDIFGIVPR